MVFEVRDVCILATGGTMDKEHDPVAEALVFSEKSHIPQMLQEYRSPELHHEVLMLKDSLEMTAQDRDLILAAVNRRPEAGVVITHGTSTMEKTAEYFQDKISNKTVVLTGAIRPFTLFRSDVGFNLGCAIAAARLAPPGVYVAMSGQIFPAGTVTKNLKTLAFETKE